MSARRENAEPLFTPRFLALWTFSFITFFSAFQLFPAIPFRILELGGSEAEAGAFLAVYTFASAFAAPLMGTFADHVGRKRLLVGVSIAFVGFSVVYGYVTNLGLLLVIGAVHGAIWSGILSSSSAIMSDYIPQSRRTEGLAYWGLASTAAIAVAPFAGLMVSSRFGWRNLCLELAVISVAMAVWSSRLTDPSVRDPLRRMPRGGELFDWRVTVASLSLFTISFGYGGVTSYVAVLAMERHLEPRALYFAVYAGAIVVSRIVTSPLGDRRGPLTLLYPALAIVPPALLLLAFATSRWQWLASATLFGAGFGVAYPAFATFVLEKTDAQRRARTFGSIIWAFDTGIGTGSLSTGVIGERFGLTSGFVVCALVATLAIPIFLVTSRHLERKLEL
jgi:predicted MFS family arabinose efflux permease